MRRLTLSQTWRLPLVIAGVAGAAFAFSTFAGAASPAPPYTGPEGKLPTTFGKVAIKKGANVTIGYQVVADNESNVAAVKLAKLEAKRLGAKLVVLYNHVDVNKQVTDFDQMIAQKLDAIIFYPLDPKAIRPSVAKAKKAGITLWAQDAILPGEAAPADLNAVMISGRDHQAYLQVKEMARLKPGAKVVVIGLGIPVAALEYYVKRVRYWAPKFGLTVLGRGDNPTDNEAGGERAMNGLLGKFPEIDGVLAYNDPSALGAVAAARASGRKVIAIGLNGGSDARLGVENGRLAATVQVGWPSMIATLIDGAYIHATQPGRKLPRLLLAKLVLVNKENLDKVPSWDDEVKQLGAKVK